MCSGIQDPLSQKLILTQKLTDFVLKTYSPIATDSKYEKYGDKYNIQIICTTHKYIAQRVITSEYLNSYWESQKYKIGSNPTTFSGTLRTRLQNSPQALVTVSLSDMTDKSESKICGKKYEIKSQLSLSHYVKMISYFLSIVW